MKPLIFLIISLLIIMQIHPARSQVLGFESRSGQVKLAPSVTPTASLDSGTRTKETPLYPTQKPIAVIQNTDEASIINSQKYASIIWQIYKGESGMGKEDVCRQYGEFNGFGYNEYTGHHPTCFTSFKEVVSRVESWIEDKVNKGFSLAELHCFYVQGVRTSSCNTSYQLVLN